MRTAPSDLGRSAGPSDEDPRGQRGNDALDELAERRGIEPQFRNAKGEIAHTNAATKRRLLAAMGVRAADEAQTRDALDRADWLRLFPPIAVVQFDARPPMIGVLALESHRQGCLIVGEDLGTVPEGFRERMVEANILSYRVLFFEQEPQTGAFVRAIAYPKRSLAIVGSHDLPTLRGWWEERDLDPKEELGLFPEPGEAARQRQARKRDRMQFLRALRGEGLLAPDGEPDIPTLARAAHAFLARTPSVLAMVQIDDLTDEADPVNVPATSDEHPNWRRRLSMTLEELATRPRFIDIAEIFRAEHGAGDPDKTAEYV